MPGTLQITAADKQRQLQLAGRDRPQDYRYIQDIRGKGWDWQRYECPGIRAVDDPREATNQGYVVCNLTGEVRTEHETEFRNREAFKPIENVIPVVIWEQRRIEMRITAETDEEAEAKAREIFDDYKDGNIAYGDLPEVIDINNCKIKSVIVGAS